jgi:hypothetical protein
MAAKGLIFMPKEGNNTGQKARPVFFEDDPNCEKKYAFKCDFDTGLSLQNMDMLECLHRNSYMAVQLAKHINGKYRIPIDFVGLHEAYIGGTNALICGDCDLKLSQLMSVPINSAPDSVQNHLKDINSSIEHGNFLYLGTDNGPYQIVHRIPCWSREQMGKFVRQITWNEIFNSIVSVIIRAESISINEDLQPINDSYHNAFSKSNRIFVDNLSIMDSKMFDFLFHLDLPEMETCLRNLGLLSEKKIRATVERTKALIQHAKELEKSGRVISPDAWAKHPWELAGFTIFESIVPTVNDTIIRLERLANPSESEQNFIRLYRSKITREILDEFDSRPPIFKEKYIAVDREDIADAKKLFQEIGIPIPQKVIDREAALEKFAKEHGK